MEYQRHMGKAILLGLCAGAVAMIAGCNSAPVPITPVSALIEDPVTLESILMKCNKAAPRSVSVEECNNARMAADQVGQERDKADAARRIAEFEKNRERLRLQQEALRRQKENATKVDPYRLPIVPPETASNEQVASTHSP